MGERIDSEVYLPGRYSMAMRRIPIADFDTIAQARAWVKPFLHTAQLGEVLDPIATKRLTALLARHPDAMEKVGPGVRAFRVVCHETGSRCFEVERVDGTRRTFSFRVCLDPGLAERTSDRWRDVARPDCSLADLDTERHHDGPSFAVLRAAFAALWTFGAIRTAQDVAELPLTDEDIETIAKAGKPEVLTIAHTRAWRAFHARYARIRAIPRAEHVERHRH